MYYPKADYLEKVKAITSYFRKEMANMWWSIGGGKMTIEKLSEILQYIQENTGIIGFTIAEYLPFDEYRLHKMFSKIGLFSE